MKGYWITFTDGSTGYCQGVSEYDVAEDAETLARANPIEPGFRRLDR